MTEEEKFSSVKRTGFNPSANRNSNPSSRGRGRSRAPGFSNYREPSNEPVPDSKFNKNPAGTNKRVGSNGLYHLHIVSVFVLFCTSFRNSKAVLVVNLSNFHHGG